MKLKPMLTEILNVPFITDNQKNLEVKDGQTGDTILSLPRYGVWMVANGKYEVVDTGDNLPDLIKKYKIKPEHIYILGDKQ
jgi:hypothetical protein